MAELLPGMLRSFDVEYLLIVDFILGAFGIHLWLTVCAGSTLENDAMAPRNWGLIRTM